MKLKFYEKNLELAKLDIKNLDSLSQLIKQKNINSITLINSKPQDLVYNYKEQINYSFINNNLIYKKIYKLLFYSFYSMKSLISKPIFEITSDRVTIHLFYYNYLKSRNRKNINKQLKISFIEIYEKKLEILCYILEKIFKKPVELDLVRLHYPYFDANIFVNILDKVINKIKIRKRIKKFIKKSKVTFINPIKFLNRKKNKLLPSFLSGFYIKIGGRLLTDRIVPRKTVLTIRKGTLTRNKFNFLDQARYISKNKRGAYSVTINIGQYLK